MSDGNILVRKLSFWHIWALGVGSVVGDGIFVMIAQGADTAGPSALISYLIAGLLMMLIMLVISEMAVGMPGAGSLHSWGSRILGPSYGTIAGLCYTGMNIIFLCAVSLANGAISNYFFQWTASSELSAIIWAIILVTLVCVIALMGGEITGKSQLYLVLVLAGIMVTFSIIGISSGKIDSANYTPFMPNGFGGLIAAAGMGIYAYMGPLSLLTAGDEVKKITDLPKAMFWAFITFLALYTVSMFVMLGLVHFTEYGSMESPYTFAAEKLFGGSAGIVMNLAAWIAAFTCLIGEVFAASRLLFGMAKEKALPSVFAKVSSKKVPYVGIISCWIIGVALIIIGNIGALSSFYVAVSMAGCGLGVAAWFILLIASYKYKIDFYEEWKALPWHVPFRGVFLPLSFIGCIAIAYAIFAGAPESIVYTAIAILIIIAFYHLYSKPNQRKFTDESK